mmetsp:Transcript_12270/g.52822  ORF Transcript_12270/g.52822 Transcript_12270/m.52822 type:complete len:211 (+) Transcript_12270:662-1294(+)
MASGSASLASTFHGSSLIHPATARTAASCKPGGDDALGFLRAMERYASRASCRASSPRVLRELDAMSHKNGAANGASRSICASAPGPPLVQCVPPPLVPVAAPSSSARPSLLNTSGAATAMRCGVTPATAACSSADASPRHRLCRARNASSLVVGSSHCKNRTSLGTAPARCTASLQLSSLARWPTTRNSLADVDFGSGDPASASKPCIA